MAASVFLPLARDESNDTPPTKAMATPLINTHSAPLCWPLPVPFLFGGAGTRFHWAASALTACARGILFVGNSTSCVSLCVTTISAKIVATHAAYLGGQIWPPVSSHRFCCCSSLSLTRSLASPFTLLPFRLPIKAARRCLIDRSISDSFCVMFLLPPATK